MNGCGDAVPFFWLFVLWGLGFVSGIMTALPKGKGHK